jgi:putative ABC transport system permease protein
MWNELSGAVGLGLIWTLMTFGVFITFRILDIADLSVEGSITMGASIAAICITHGMNPLLALLISFIGGMAAGLVTGVLHTMLKIPALLSGILTMIALWSINLHIMGKANVSLLRETTVFSFVMDRFGWNKNIAVIAVAFVFVAAVFFLLYWFFGTEIGCAVRATGDNPHMARAQGVATDRMKRLGLVLSNGFVALSGGLIAQSQSFSDIQMGTGAIVIGLASLIIGEVLFGRRTFLRSLISVICGAVVYRVIIAGVLRLGMPANDLKLFTAITVAFALSLPTIQKRLRSRGAGRRKAC